MPDEQPPKRFASIGDFLPPTDNSLGHLQPMGTFTGVYDGRPECPRCHMRFVPLTGQPAPGVVVEGYGTLPLCEACAVQLLIT